MSSKMEEISEPYHPNLQNMPKVVMEEVLKNLKNLDFRSIFRLRKVCHDLRFTVDKINPELHLHRIFFELPLTTSSLESYLENKDESQKENLMEIHKPRTGCTIKWQQENKYRFSEISVEEVETLLKNPKLILYDMFISLLFSFKDTSKHIEKKEEDLKKFYESMKSLLENIGHLLQLNGIVLHVNRISEAAEFLKCIDPKSLKHISMTTRDRNASGAIGMDFSELEALEQWKKAETLRIHGNYILTPVESFASFKLITLFIKVISIEKLNKMIEFFIRSPKLKTVIIESNECSEMKNLLISNFSQFDSDGNEFENVPVYKSQLCGRQKTWKWLKNVPGSTEKLRIILTVGWENYIKFSKV